MPSAVLDTLDHWVGRAIALLGVLGALAIFFLAAVTLVAVFWRYVLNDPIFGIEDVSTMALAVVVACAIAYGATQRAHVSVNVLGHFATRRATRFTDAFVRLAGVGVVGLTAYALATKGSCGLACGASTPNLNISHRPFYLLLAVAMGVYCALLVLQFLRGLLHFGDAEDPNAIGD